MNAMDAPLPKTRPILHVIFWTLLASWELQSWIRRGISRSLLRILTAFLALILFVLIVTSISSLSKIGGSMRSLRGDSLIGLEVAVTIRGIVREVQLKVLRHATSGKPGVTGDELATFRLKIRDLLANYKAGIFEVTDQENSRYMEQSFVDYEHALNALAGATGNDFVLLKNVEITGDEMILAASQAYEFNRLRLRASADEAGVAAQSALRLTQILWAGSAAFVFLLIFLVLIDRWVARTELASSLN